MNRPAPKDEPDPRDRRHAIRAALLHAWTLAAAHEGRGASVPVESTDDDYECLSKVVDLLLEHRAKKLAASKLKNALGLVELITPIYRAYLADKALGVDDLRKRLEVRVHELRLNTPPEWLAKLAVPRDAFKKSKFHKQGAVETARFLVGKILGVSGSSLSHQKDTWRRDGTSPATAFGRVTSTGAATAYARQVLEWEPAEDSPERAPWLIKKMLDDVGRTTILAMPAMLEAATERRDAALAAPAVHPVLRDELDRVSNKGLDDGRWPADLVREELEAFAAGELAVFDGCVAPPLVDRDPPVAAAERGAKSPPRRSTARAAPRRASKK